MTRRNVGLVLLLAAVALLPFADLEIGGHDPWRVLGRVLAGFLAPSFATLASLGDAIALTLAFAFFGVALGAAVGLALAVLHHRRAVRIGCAVLRSVHELFWALLLIQPLGPSASAGVLAIAIPYAGIFGKVFAEILDEIDRRPADVLPPRTGRISAFLFARLPLALGPMRVYGLYRVECGLRSSAVLGFVGLPTLGFELDTFFRQGEYGSVAAVLLAYYALIGTMRLWMRPRLVPFYLLGTLAVLAGTRSVPLSWDNVTRFLTEDLVPAPLRDANLLDVAPWAELGDWLGLLVGEQAVPGMVATLVVSQITIALMGLLALAAYPLLVPAVVGRVGRGVGHVILVVARSTPEFMLCYLALQILGPSMLPAILALGIHNGAIIAHLLGREAERVVPMLRPDAPRGLDLHAYELTPRLYAPFLAYVFYRWEIVVRESAIVGMLGIQTLGFFVDSAIAEIRLDRALVLLMITAAVTLAIDAVSRLVRRRLGLGAFGGLEARTARLG